jgi:23S rRNA pseudouridine1911/1915/1917 synthase
MTPEVLFQDKHLLVLNKPPGMPVQPDPTGDDALLDWANQHANKTMHLAHRIDRPVSGVVLLAATAEAMTHLTDQFRQQLVDKVYLALVQAPPPAESGNLLHYIGKSKTGNKSILYPDAQPGTAKAELHYRLVSQTQRYWLLEIIPVSGRHHQIRAQLAAMGCPIRGDVKYGARRGNPDRSIQLHAWKIAFEHPLTGERLNITAKLPDLPIWQVS